MRNLRLVSVAILILVGLVSCEDSPVVPVELTPMEESLCGNWSLSRVDNCMEITTSFEIKDDYGCTYSQSICDGDIDEINEVNKITLNGKWRFNSDDSTLTFDLNNDDGSKALTIDCIVVVSKDKAVSFKINDAFSEKDNYCFTKEN